MLLLILSGRLFQVQGLDPAGMAQAAIDNRVRSFPVAPLRGDIIGAQGDVLATTVQRYDITVDQQNVLDEFTRITPENELETVTKEQAVQELAEVLGHDPEDVKRAITGEDRFHYVAKSVSPAVRDKIIALGIPGIVAQATSQRTYPSGAVAGSILGYVGSDNVALAGIELTKDEVLRGKPGKITYQIGADGIPIPTAPRQEKPAVDGKTIQLTINQDIQWFAQQQIASQVERLNAEWGNIVVLEAETGKIVAMAQSESPDPNNPGATPADRRQALSVTEAFEPGSTEKMITMAAAIEEGIAKPLSEFTVPPTYTVNGQSFSDAFEHGTQERTMAGIFGDSMNTGTVMIGEQLTKQQRYDWLRKFGIGEPTGVPLPGETGGILAKPENWDGRQEFTVLFGQGVAQTALQTAVAYQAIANDGVMLKPRLIEAYIDPDGTRHEVPAPKGDRVVSHETAQMVQDMLETTVTDAGAQLAQMDSYRVGGKTGTAEAPGKHGGYDGYTASFVGMAPMEDPKYVVGVTLQRPQGNIYGITAAPTFTAVMGRTLHTFDVPPSTGKPVHLPLFAADKKPE
ncbi:MAG TPA: penicillin-binding protein 2 [Arthrobacter sp.]|nr:penicillin-binding protein 2 [Arthrobacter sp.]